MQPKIKPRLRAPFAWIGGKSKLAPDIIKQIPEHTRYIEVFGGALNVFYGKERSKIEVVNDINGDLVNLHRIIRSNPQSLAAYLNTMLISREVFDDIRLGRWKSRNNIERAGHYFYLIMQSFGAKGVSFAMNAKSRRPKNIYRSFRTWSERLKYVTIENMSFEKLIDQYDGPDAFFYCDPPYVETEHYYKNTGGFGIDHHRLLAEKLKNIKGRVLISYNDCDLVRELYQDFTIVTSREIEYTLGKNMHKRNKKVNEVFIKNY